VARRGTGVEVRGRPVARGERWTDERRRPARRKTGEREGRRAVAGREREGPAGSLLEQPPPDAMA